LSFHISIECIWVFIWYKRKSPSNIKIKSTRCKIILIKSMSENIHISSKAFFIRNPNVFKRLFIESFFSILIVNSSKKYCIKPHFCKYSCICIRMSKWINLPSNSWLHTKFIENEIMAYFHVINHIFINWASFIVHWPSSIDQLQLTIFYQFFNIIFHFLILIFPPHAEKFHFNFWKFSFRILHQSHHDSS